MEGFDQTIPEKTPVERLALILLLSIRQAEMSWTALPL
jgi:hypothetical protein